MSQFLIFCSTVNKGPKCPCKRADPCYKKWIAPPKQHPEWKKSDPAAHTLYDSVYIKRPEQVNPQRQKVE